MKNYNESISDFTEYLDTTSYKYTDGYLWLGCTKYANNDKANALGDFMRHRDIIKMCMKDAAETNLSCLYTIEDLNIQKNG